MHAVSGHTEGQTESASKSNGGNTKLRASSGLSRKEALQSRYLVIK